MNIDYLNQGEGPRLMVVHRGYRVRGGEDVFFQKILIPQLIATGISFEIVAFPALFSKKEFWVIDTIETFLMGLGIEKWRPSFLEVWRRVAKSKPTHVIFNNFVPTISLEAAALCRAQGALVLAWADRKSTRLNSSHRL